jgi:transcriptional regulator with XRE-family HTH domain
MISFEYDIGGKSRAGARFISRVRREVQRAFASEKAERKLTQQDIATKLGVNRSVINRQLSGLDNMTLRSAAELLWAIGWEPVFEAQKCTTIDRANDIQRIDLKPDQPRTDNHPPAETGTDSDSVQWLKT